MNSKLDIKIVYKYIHDDLSQQKLAELFREDYPYDLTKNTVKQILIDYGFNSGNANNSSDGYAGADKGKFNSAYCRNKFGINRDITMDDVKDFMVGRDNREIKCYFDKFIADRVEEEADEREAAAKAEAEEKALIERQKKEEKEQKERERKEQEALRLEEEKRQKAQDYFKKGEKAFSDKDYSSAKYWFECSRQYKHIYKTNYYISKCIEETEKPLSTTSAERIVSEMNKFIDYCSRNNETIYSSYYYVLGDAYYVLGNKSKVCDAYFFAGDIHFDNENYFSADRAYTQGREKSGYYSVNSVDAPYRIAYAHYKTDSSDKKFIVSWVDKALKKGVAVSKSLNLLFHYLSLPDDIERIIELWNEYSNYFSGVDMLRMAFTALIETQDLCGAAEAADSYSRCRNVRALPALDMAQAYLFRGMRESRIADIGKVCDLYFIEGDKYFTQDDFAKADELYTLGYESTFLWSAVSEDAPYRMAYSRSRACSNSESDLEYIRRWYGVAIDCGICEDEAEKELEKLDS